MSILTHAIHDTLVSLFVTGTYTSACDVWSYGILMWEIFSLGNTPYSGLTNNQAREKVDEGTSTILDSLTIIKRPL